MPLKPGREGKMGRWEDRSTYTESAGAQLGKDDPADGGREEQHDDGNDDASSR